MLQKCEGIILRTIDYGETNKIVTLFTREWGKIGVMANGAKKPKSKLAAITQPFTYGYFLVQKGSGLGRLQQGEMISSFRLIRENIFLTAYASYIVELTDKCTEEKQPFPSMFQLLFKTLDLLNEKFDPEILKNIFELKMLPVLGLNPQLDQCVKCGSKMGYYNFSIKEGGILCHQCIMSDPLHLKISTSTVKLLRLFYYLDINRLGSITVKPETKLELKKVIDSYYEEYSGLYLKTKKFLAQIENMQDLI